MGDDYRHPIWLFVLGILVVIAAAFVGVTSMKSLLTLF